MQTAILLTVFASILLTLSVCSSVAFFYVKEDDHKAYAGVAAFVFFCSFAVCLIVGTATLFNWELTHPPTPVKAEVE